MSKRFLICIGTLFLNHAVHAMENDDGWLKVTKEEGFEDTPYKLFDVKALKTGFTENYTGERPIQPAASQPHIESNPPIIPNEESVITDENEQSVRSLVTWTIALMQSVFCLQSSDEETDKND